jgi:ubiquinone/menaquinone biosynthesis C-methylase UbiE
MYACVDPLLELYPDSEWLTVGDGRFGKDAHYLLSKGHNVVASDISDTLLRVAAAKGYIRDFKAANAESLPFGNGSFDFVFCKESYHHFPRPMLALYEMLRVAKKGAVLIEPSEAPSLESARVILKHLFHRVLLRCGISSILRTRDTSVIRSYANSWEEVGNYVYSISQREIEKVALGMGYASCAFKGLNDYYEKGVEFETATENSLLFQKVKERIAHADHLCREALNSNAYNLLVAVIFKPSLGPDAVQVLERTGFVVRQLPRNPHTTQGDSQSADAGDKP